jgi:hypothetical protein
MQSPIHVDCLGGRAAIALGWFARDRPLGQIMRYRRILGVGLARAYF